MIEKMPSISGSLRSPKSDRLLADAEFQWQFAAGGTWIR